MHVTETFINPEYTVCLVVGVSSEGVKMLNMEVCIQTISVRVVTFGTVMRGLGGL